MKAVYPRLAFDGIRKNKRLYLPYILTCIGTVTMFYIIHHLAAMPALKSMPGGDSTVMILGLGVWVVAFFSLIFLVYTNSFLMRRRKKEFGLYNILGMGKKNLSLVLLFETLTVAAISVLSGIAAGIALSKLAESGLVYMVNGKVSYKFTVNVNAVLDTLLIFGGIFLLLYLKSLISIWRLNAISLIKSENTGEKPPRANYVLGIGGIILLAAAYYMAVSIESPLLAISWFFIAVLAVIAGTYMIFISGSVMLCRILQKNKRYYYRKNHFVSVSSMVYRMKRNGAGLASICVLSTMVLVMILGAGSLYFGAEDSLRARYPKSITVTTDYNPYDEKTVYSAEKADKIVSEVDNVVSAFGAAPKNTERYTSATVACLLSGGTLTANPELVNAADASTIKNVCNVIFISLYEYNRCMNKSETLKDDEIFIHCVRRKYNNKTLTIGELKYTVKKQLDDMINNGRAASEMVPSMFVVMNNPEKAYDEVNSQFTSDTYFCCPRLYYSFDTGLSAERDIELADKISERLRDMDINGTGGYYSRTVECREAERADFYGTYGGLFYLGIILSTVFLLATVLIIYYKQITEGYEDESRFEIMQKVGMTKRDIQKSINSQMLTVFLLPLITAALHLCFAFPMIRRLLTLFNLNNVPLMLIVLAGAVLVFGVLYALIYKFTSNSYFAIVSGKNESK